jgi:tRNA1Val (adenine37-N6)-methyltransferase
MNFFTRKNCSNFVPVSKPFQFKEFKVHQENAAMKVGTDGVLLGAWTPIKSSVNKILDIGTGTGLIALMMAQRSNAEVIDAVELDALAYVEAFENFERSPWGDRLFVYHASIQDFADELDESYDLIVSNPPFFSMNNDTATQQRGIARQQSSLNYLELLKATKALLHPTGDAAFIIPFQDEGHFLEIAQTYELYPNSITRVKGAKGSPFKRSLLMLHGSKDNLTPNNLIVEIERHRYTDEFKALVSPFYLNL